jgi:bis(5'-nucleosyl)-tetraphosphatase (symmetrical)
MSTYAIGDVQGCFDELQRLLEKINFDSAQDTLVFVGDLVNRGPKSLETLEFIYHLPKKIVVLGNHDLYLINLVYNALPSNYKPHTLAPLLESPYILEWVDWLRHQPLMYKNDRSRYIAVHAGIPPQWNVEQAYSHANEVSKVLRSEHFFPFLKQMFGDKPHCWNDNLIGFDRLRYITNAFTRMRFCNSTGCLDTHTIIVHENDSAYQPWFKWKNSLEGYRLYFGHWAALKGKCNQANCFALDTGCVWGGKLTALCLETQKTFSVNSNFTAPAKN